MLKVIENEGRRGMFVDFELLNDANLKDVDLKVLLSALSFMQDGQTCTATSTQIANKIGLKTGSAVSKKLSTMADNGLLEKKSKWRNGTKLVDYHLSQQKPEFSGIDAYSHFKKRFMAEYGYRPMEVKNDVSRLNEKVLDFGEETVIMVIDEVLVNYSRHYATNLKEYPVPTVYTLCNFYWDKALQQISPRKQLTVAQTNDTMITDKQIQEMYF